MQLPKTYERIETVGAFTIARKRDLFYIFDADGGINLEACFTTVEKARAYIPTMDHLVRFSGALSGPNRWR